MPFEVCLASIQPANNVDCFQPLCWSIPNQQLQDPNQEETCQQAMKQYHSAVEKICLEKQDMAEIQDMPMGRSQQRLVQSLLCHM